MAVTPKKRVIKPRAAAVPVVLNEAPETVEPVKPPKWPLYVIAGLALVVIILLVILFSRKPKPPATVVDRTPEIEALKREATAYREMARLDSIDKEEYKKLAFELLNKPLQNKTYYIESKKQYDKIPTNINNLNREQLRSEITDLIRAGKKP